MNMYDRFIEGISFRGDIKKDVELLFDKHNELGTYQHTLSVANEAIRIAKMFNVDSELAAQAAFLHDISNVIPKTSMIDIAAKANIDILEEEYRYHRIIHQKLSKDMASKIFGCTNIFEKSKITWWKLEKRDYGSLFIT